MTQELPEPGVDPIADAKRAGGDPIPADAIQAAEDHAAEMAKRGGRLKVPEISPDA